LRRGSWFCHEIIIHSLLKFRIIIYVQWLRRIKYHDHEADTTYVYLTNNFDIPAQTIAELYRHRWQIELFFKWIKQHLKIQVFWGYSFNAVKTQICIAISTFLLVAIAKKQMKVKQNLYEILQILQVSQFEKTALSSLISTKHQHVEENETKKQLKLAEFWRNTSAFRDKRSFAEWNGAKFGWGTSRVPNLLSRVIRPERNEV